MAYLTQRVHRGAAPQRGGKKHAALRGGPEMPRLLCCRISLTRYSESARSSAAHSAHFRPIPIPAITRTGSWATEPAKKSTLFFQPSAGIKANTLQTNPVRTNLPGLWRQLRGLPPQPNQKREQFRCHRSQANLFAASLARRRRLKSVHQPAPLQNPDVNHRTAYFFHHTCHRTTPHRTTPHQTTPHRSTPHRSTVWPAPKKTKGIFPDPSSAAMWYRPQPLFSVGGPAIGPRRRRPSCKPVKNKTSLFYRPVRKIASA